MTRAVLCSVLLLCCPLFLTGELLSPFNGDTPIETGSVENPLLFQAGAGSCFFVYTKNGDLAVKYSPDNGSTFAAIVPDYGGLELSNAGSLQLMKNQGNGGLVFLRAEVNGTTGIYCLQLTGEGTAKLTTTTPLDDPEREGTPGDYRVIPAPAGYVLVYHKGNFLGITRLKTDWSRSYLNTECPGIENFELRMSFRAGPPFYCGVLERLVGDKKHIDYYELDGTGLTVKPVLTMAAASPVQYQLITAPGGAMWLVYLAGGKIYGKALVDGSWVDLKAGNPLSGADGISLMDFFIFSDMLFLCGYVPDSSGYKVYGCTIDTANAVKQMKSGGMLTGVSIKDKLSFAPLKDGNILIQYQEAAGGNFGIQKYDRASDSLTAYPVVMPGDIISASFIHFKPSNWLLVVNTLAAGKNKMIVYEYNPEEDKYLFKQETSVYADSVGVPGEMPGDNIHLFTTADGKLIYDASTNQSSLVESACTVEFYESLYGDSFILLEKQGEYFLRKVNRGVQG